MKFVDTHYFFDIWFPEAIHGKLDNADDDEIADIIKNWLKSSSKRIDSERYEHIPSCKTINLDYIDINFVVQLFYQETVGKIW